MFSWKSPKDDHVFSWTQHAGFKMRQYGLSATKVKNVIRRPVRTEEAIAEGVAAAMQPAGHGKKPSEIWVMYVPVKVRNTKTPAQLGERLETKIKVVSAWRYPGKSEPRGPVPIPEDIRDELKKLFNIRL